MRSISLAIVLFVFWLALSGHYSAMLVGIGLGTAIAAAAAMRRLNILDAEAHPTEVVAATLTYWPWLFWEIVKSAWTVTKVILHPKLPVSPTMTTVEASQTTPVGIATYGNSITLTPGTITTDVSGNRLIVHALMREGAIDLEEGGMDRRVRQFEGGA